MTNEGALLLNSDEVHVGVAARPGTNLVSLTAAIIVGIALDRSHDFALRARHNARVNPVRGSLPYQEEAACSDPPEAGARRL